MTGIPGSTLHRRLWRQGVRLILLAATAGSLAASADEAGTRHSMPTASSPPGVVSSAFNGTAYLKTSHTVVFAGKSFGLGRATAQLQIDQCNGFRKSYGVTPVSPPESLMATLDVSTDEKYFDTNKAMTLITGSLLTLPDVRRWLDEAQVTAPSGKRPATPPDCARTKMVERRHGTLWRDGLVYRLRYDDRKAFGNSARAVPPLEGMATAFLNAPRSTQLGQTCREMVGGADLPGEGHSCIWDLFPYVNYLNWPFALSGRHQFGPTAAMFETVVPIAAEHGRPIPSSVFDIPDGFTVIRY